MKWRIPKRVILGCWITTMLFVLGGCVQKDVAGPGGDSSGAPILPDVSTMQFDLGFLGELPVDKSSVELGKPSGDLAVTAGERSNWINAVVRALHVQLMLYDALEEPVAAFAYAIHSVPQRQEDGSYLWTYIFVEGELEYSVFLYGNPMEDRVAWRMEVSTNHPELVLDHFVWFDGESMNDDSQGHWQFYEPVLGSASNGAASARIDWFHEPSENRLRVFINSEASEEAGDWLEFRETAEVGTIDHYDASALVSSNITAFKTGDGSIQVPDYNDGLQACWDTQQVNAVCPK